MGNAANEKQRKLIKQGEARKEKYYLLVVQNLREHKRKYQRITGKSRRKRTLSKGT